jgi:ABC-type bacteriocin/lantibiotic exporter with double-glycine peptidase domain
MMRIPFIFALGFYALYHFFQWTFISGVAVVGISIGIQTILTYRITAINKAVMKAKDARMNVTTEAMTHIKMLKLYSWERNLVKRIQRKRQEEISTLRQKVVLVAILIAGNYFFPNLLSFAVFATYIFIGGNLTLDVAIMSLILLQMVTGAMNEVPWFTNAFMEMIVSNKRIQKFLLSDEV